MEFDSIELLDAKIKDPNKKYVTVCTGRPPKAEYWNEDPRPNTEDPEEKND